MDELLIDRLRTDLEAVSYRVTEVELLLGAAADGARQRGVFAPARRMLAERGVTPLGSLVRLFLLGDAVEASLVEASLPALGVSGAESLGLISVDTAASTDQSERSFRAALSLNPVQIEDAAAEESPEWWILSDLDDQLRTGPARPDHVMGVGGATRSLIAQAPTEAVEVSLDLGTGCGIVALHLSLRGSVVATDISSRALMFARANTRLNGVRESIDFREGNLFEPVAGEQFDVILSNPPFVITPREEGVPQYEYRDGGMTGDELAEQVVVSAPAYLSRGGTLVCLANWESPWGGNGLERVGGWVREAAALVGPLSAWIIERDRLTPEQYAETWARDGGARPGEVEYEGLVSAWLSDFLARRVTAIGMGSVRLCRERSSEAETIVHAEQAAGQWIQAQRGLLLEQAFAAATAAERLSDADVLGTRWKLDPAVTEERLHRPGEEAPYAITLTTDRPITRRVTADTLLAAALGACDGELTLQQIADALATILEVDPEAAAEALIVGVRELTWLGMIAPLKTVDWSGDENH